MNIYRKIRSILGKIKRKPLIFETLSVIYGIIIYKKLMRRLGKDTNIILLRGATGDNYLQLLLLNEYIIQHDIKKYAIVAMLPGALWSLQDIFYLSDVVYIKPKESNCIQRVSLFLNDQHLNITMPFYWEKSLGFTYNRCRVRMLERFNFMDTYVYFSYCINYPLNFREPSFKQSSVQNEFIWQKQGIVPGKTIIISPEANSVTNLPIWFWNGIISELQQKGYCCLINSNHPNFYRAPNCFPSYIDSVPILELAGYFLGVRSGFCDIVSTAKCKKVIIYPQIKKEINYSEHRSEIEFSGLKEMGLIEKDDDSCVEFSTPLVRNVTDRETLLEGTDDFFDAINLLREQILSQFK